MGHHFILQGFILLFKASGRYVVSFCLYCSGFIAFIEPSRGSHIQFELFHNPRVLLSTFHKLFKWDLAWIQKYGQRSQVYIDVTLHLITIYYKKEKNKCLVKTNYRLCFYPQFQRSCHRADRGSFSRFQIGYLVFLSWKLSVGKNRLDIIAHTTTQLMYYTNCSINQPSTFYLCHLNRMT